MIYGFGRFPEQEAGLLNSEKQTKVLLALCWVGNHISDMKNRARWHPKSNSLLMKQQSMVATVVGNAWWHELILTKQHDEGLGWSWTGSLGALREDLINVSA